MADEAQPMGKLDTIERVAKLIGNMSTTALLVLLLGFQSYMNLEQEDQATDQTFQLIKQRTETDVKLLEIQRDLVSALKQIAESKQ